MAPSATFTDGRVAGSSGCNRYTAPYALDGEDLTIGELATTQMAHHPLGEAVRREYFAALARVAGWRLSGDELVLQRAVAGRRLEGDRSPSGRRRGVD